MNRQFLSLPPQKKAGTASIKALGCIILSVLILSLAQTRAKAQLPLNLEQGFLQLSTVKQKGDTNEIKALYRRADLLIGKYPDSAMALFGEGINRSRQMGYDYGVAAYILGMSRAIAYNGDPAQALVIARKALPLCLLLRRDDLWAIFNLSYAQHLNALGYKDSAVQYSHLALQSLERHRGADSAEIRAGMIYLEIGTIYMDNGSQDCQLAIPYFEKALLLAERNGRLRDLPEIYTGLGGAYANLNLNDTGSSGYRKGLTMLFKAEAIGKSLKDTALAATPYLNISAIYTNLNLLDSAEFFLKKALSSLMASERPEVRVHANIILASAFFKKKMYTKAAVYFLIARDLASGRQAKHQLLDIDKSLYQTYLYSGNYKQALAYLQQYTFLRDSLLDKEKISATRRFEIRYQSAEKDKEILANKLQLDQQHHKIKTQERWMISALVFSLLSGALLLLIYRNNRHRRRLQEERLNNLAQQQEITSLKAMVQGEEQERGRLARELHDGIVGQLVAVKMNFSEVRQRHPSLRDARDFEEAMSQLEDAALDLRKTAHNLMPEILVQQGFVDTLAFYCSKMTKWAGFPIYFHLAGILPALTSDAALSLYRMVQELIQNIIKHAQATEAVVQLNCHDPLLLLTVEDNGKGMDPAQLQKDDILKTVRTRVQVLKGKINLQSRPGKGTTITIEFDLNHLKEQTQDPKEPKAASSDKRIKHRN